MRPPVTLKPSDNNIYLYDNRLYRAAQHHHTNGDAYIEMEPLDMTPEVEMLVSLSGQHI